MNECEINNTSSHDHILFVENVQTFFDQSFRWEFFLEQEDFIYVGYDKLGVFE